MEAQATGEGAVIDEFDFIEKVTLTDDERLLKQVTLFISHVQLLLQQGLSLGLYRFQMKEPI